MAVETPARIAILGGGPIGIETALYARFLGYEVTVYERRQVAQHPRQSWAHVRMFSPFSMNRSKLGLAALKAQDEGYEPPRDDALLTGREWTERYLLPLSQSDLISDHIAEHTTVVSVGREHRFKHELPEVGDGGDMFRILLRSADGSERVESADAVIDVSGVFDQPNWIGQGGVPAIGEQAVRERIEFGLPDLSGEQHDRFVERRILLVGSGYSAATNAVALARIAAESPATGVTWITRRPSQETSQPITRIESDRLPERDRLASSANDIALKTDSPISHWPGTSIDAIQYDADQDVFSVTLNGQHAGTFEFDRIIANVGYRPDLSLTRELQVHYCYASEGPMKLAAALLGNVSADCLDQTSCGPQTLLNPEPNFYVLGSKSYGRNSNFLFSLGLEQIREIFTIIGDRPDLDLYARAESLPR
jgi:thioredoxin reductase